MVGCHRGKIEGCTIRDSETEPASSGVQMKGGTSEVALLGCRFENAGQRAVNAGGSTGLQYFRPKPEGFEARALSIEGCTFIGSETPIAFVGVDGALVRFNTFYRPRKWFARILQENSIELRKLIEGLLNYSAVHAQTSYLDARIVPLNDLVRRVLNDRKLAIVAKGIRIELDTENVAAYCDEGKIRVVLDNLLSNAIKFSPEKGLISFRLYKDRGDAVLEVADEGPGIPEPEREKVFEAFYKSVDQPVSVVKGSGLGLSIVKEYVTLHRGRIEILEGPGAHFRIRLPRRRQDVEEAAA